MTCTIYPNTPEARAKTVILLIAECAIGAVPQTNHAE